MNMSAKTIMGFEQLVADELLALGAQEVELATRAVKFKGDMEMLYKANLHSRCALKILRHLTVFPARTPEELYAYVNEWPWENWMDVDQTLAVDAVVHHSNITHSQFAALKIKDAIVDRFRDKMGRRPSVDVLNPHLQLHAIISGDKCVLALDSSGDSLHMRNYRKQETAAPLSEVLAAGMLKMAGWKGETNFVDFMCGSGTILIEAGLIACNIPAGYKRKHFAFMNWNDYDANLWKRVKDASTKDIKTELDIMIMGCDIDRKSADLASENIARAGLDELIDVYPLDFRKLNPPPAPGIIVSNPPYGKRLQPHDLNVLYKEIGDELKTRYAGYTAWILAEYNEAMKNIGLKPAQRIPLLNGALDCRLLKFELYQGSKRPPKEEQI